MHCLRFLQRRLGSAVAGVSVRRARAQPFDVGSKTYGGSAAPSIPPATRRDPKDQRLDKSKEMIGYRVAIRCGYGIVGPAVVAVRVLYLPHKVEGLLSCVYSSAYHDATDRFWPRSRSLSVHDTTDKRAGYKMKIHRALDMG